MSVRLLLIVALIHDLPARSIDFVLAFPQAELDVPVFMELPVGMEVARVIGVYIIELKPSLYGLKQDSCNWFEKLKEALEHRGYKPSQIDPCVYISKEAIISVYVVNIIMVSKEKKKINAFIQSLNIGKENFEFTDDRLLKDYLGVNFTRHPDGTMELK